MNRIFALVFLPLLFSFTFSPMSQSIDLGENQKATQYLIENGGTEPMAIDLSVKERIMDEKGEETLKDTKDMLILPPQIIVPPGDKRTIRINWTGKDIPSVEKNYRVIAEQLDLDVNKKAKKQGGVKMLMKYMATLYLTPKDAESDISVTSFTSSKDQLKLVIKNSGNKHQILGDPKITFEDGDTEVVLKSQDLKGLAGENVLGKSSREFIIKTNRNISSKSKVNIKVD